jgi:hypothetical protein
MARLMTADTTATQTPLTTGYVDQMFSGGINSRPFPSTRSGAIRRNRKGSFRSVVDKVAHD